MWGQHPSQGGSCYLPGMQPTPWPHQGVPHLLGWAEDCLVAIQMAVVGVVAPNSSGSSHDGVLSVKAMPLTNMLSHNCNCKCNCTATAT